MHQQCLLRLRERLEVLGLLFLLRNVIARILVVARATHQCACVAHGVRIHDQVVLLARLAVARAHLVLLTLLTHSGQLLSLFQLDALQDHFLKL